MRALADNGAFWVLALLAPIVVFCVPTLIAVIRRAEWLPLVVLFNVTGIGWPAALMLAFGPRREQAPPPVWPPGGVDPPHDWYRFYRVTWDGRFRAFRIDGGPPLEGDTSLQLWDLMHDDFYRRPPRSVP